MSDSVVVLIVLEAAILVEALLFYPILLWYGRCMYRYGVSHGERFERIEHGEADGQA